MAQSENRRIVGASIFWCCVSLALTALTARTPEITEGGTSLLSRALAPLQSGIHYVSNAITETWNSYLSLIDVKQDNKRLQQRLAVVEAENSKLSELAAENNRLRALLKVSENEELKVIVPATAVLAYDPTNWSKKITIDSGSDSGVEVGHAVISGNGVVGQVIAVNAKTAQVLLLTDPSSGVDALVQRSRTRAVLDGTGGNRCRLMFSSTSDDLRNGDRIITSGLDGVFPKGLSLGVAIHIGSDEESEKGMLFRSNVWVQPSVDFNRLETVMVVSAS